MEEDVVLDSVSPARTGGTAYGEKKRKLTVKNAQKVKPNPTVSRN